ncbi:MAG: hypothetical protein DRI69_01765 [Bacteroidetes bacterium]|nr:MAG: hypothetical protein DRI69_01765 [Bacteroidota bacterium]
MNIMRMHKILLLATGLFLFLDIWAYDSMTVTVDSVHIDIGSDSLLVCTGTTITLSATPADTYAWSPEADFDDPTLQTVMLTPSQSQWYFLTAGLNGVDYVDSVYISLIDPTFNVTVSTMDTICPEDRVDITFDASHPITSVSWNPQNEVLDPDDINGTVVHPLQTTEYIVTALIGNCEISDTFTIQVVPFALTVIDDDTVYLCKPSEAFLRLQVTPGNLDVSWTPLDGFIEPNAQGTVARVFPEITTTYTASASFMGCDLERDIYVRVDSLPDLEPLTVLFPKDPFCSGDSMWIIGPRVDTALYPDLVWQWIPLDGQIVGPGDVPGTTGNVRIILQDTTQFVRFADNNACRDSSSVIVNVIPPEIPLSVNDTSLCPGDKFKVEVLDKDVEDLMWMPEEGLSCTECFEPEVTVGSESVTYMVTGMKEGCPVGAQLQVNVLPFFSIPVDPPQAFGCEGDQIQLVINDIGLTNLNIIIVGDGTISCDDCNTPVVTIHGSGTLRISADVPDSLGCGAFATIPYGVGPVEMIVDRVFVCPNEPTVIDLTGYGFENPVVNLQGNGECNDSDCLMPVVQVDEGGGSITIEADNCSEQCCGSLTTIQLIPYSPSGGMIVALDSMPFGRGETITVELQPPGADGTDYQWFVDGVLQDDIGNPAMVTFPNEGPSTVTVFWTNDNGCVEEASIVYFIDPAGINFPNAFTPNGDGTNDTFRPTITGNGILDELLVFNRWGQLVYQGSDLIGWNGDFNGEIAPAEVYAYRAIFLFAGGGKEEFKGDVTLIR